MSDMRAKVRGYIIENFLFGQGNDLQDNTSFLEQGILDSTGVLELVTFLEETFSVKIEADETLPENLDSIDSICAFLERKRKAAA
ncbi:MAG: acyl carrier protein [Verrucomicrobia bacterium]|nr:acyl carrier protein [Verrucomicrobiota bacterium]